MSTIRAFALVMLTVSVAAAVACSKSDSGAGDSSKMASATPTMASTPAPHAMFMGPAEGDSVSGDSVHVMMHVEGAKIVPTKDATGAQVPLEGHLHLFLDRDVTPAGTPIPMDSTVVHLGNGATDYVFRKLAKGAHRIIVVFAFTDHTPDIGVATDTVNIVVK